MWLDAQNTRFHEVLFHQAIVFFKDLFSWPVQHSEKQLQSAWKLVML